MKQLTLIPIQGFPEYLIQPNGLIYSKHRHRRLKHHNNNDYRMVYLTNLNTGICKWKYVHVLLAVHFIPVPDRLKDHPGELWVNHKNGKKWDNRLKNLEWTTISENIIHALEAGLHSNKRRKPK